MRFVNLRGMARKTAAAKVLAGRGRHPAGRALGEKLENLKLIRSLDLAGVVPNSTDLLPRALAALTEYDCMLTAALETLDREGDPSPGSSDDPIQLLFALGAAVRAAVLDAVPAEARRRVVDSLSRVGVNEAEVWLEVEELRRSGEPAPEDTPRLVGARLDEAERALREGAPPPPDDERVSRVEAQPFPRSSGIEPWLERLPEGWLRVTARLYDLAPAPRARKADLAREVAARIREPETLRRVLREHIGPEERWILARMVAGTDVPLSEMDRATAESFDVHWEWPTLPPGSGGKLRAYGLAFVGRKGGARSLSYPRELGDLLDDALLDVDPDVIDAVDETLDDALEDLPFDDPEIDEWKEADRAATDAIVEATRRPPDAAVREYFEERSPVTSGDETIAVADFFAFDWRRGELIRSHLAKCRTIPARTRTLLEAAAASPVSVYRVLSVTPMQGVQLNDEFRGGTVFVTDRKMSLTAAPGQVIRLRVYAAGAFHFARTAKGPLPEQALPWLEGEFAYYAETHKPDRTAFLRDRVILLHRLPYLFDAEDEADAERAATR